MLIFLKPEIDILKHTFPSTPLIQDKTHIPWGQQTEVGKCHEGHNVETYDTRVGCSPAQKAEFGAQPIFFIKSFFQLILEAKGTHFKNLGQFEIWTNWAFASFGSFIY